MMVFSMYKMHKLLPRLLFVCLAVLALPSTLTAATTYSVTPLVIDEVMQSRDFYRTEIIITNSSTHKITVFPTVNEISLAEGGGTTEFIPPSMADDSVSITSWIEIQRSSVEVEIGESKAVPLTLHTAPDVVPGEYHALLGFGSGRNVEIAKQQVKNGQAPSVVVTITIEDNRSPFLSLTGFVVDRFVTEAENESASYTVDNSGDLPITPTGEVIIYDSNGGEVGAVPINAAELTIEPGKSHTFNATVPTSGLLGKYKAFLSVEYGNDQRATIHDTVFFYVFPWKKIVITFIIVLLLAVFLTLYLHRRSQSYHDDSVEHVPLFVREAQSESQHHDIDLKK